MLRLQLKAPDRNFSEQILRLLFEKIKFFTLQRC